MAGTAWEVVVVRRKRCAALAEEQGRRSERSGYKGRIYQERVDRVPALLTCDVSESYKRGIIALCALGLLAVAVRPSF
eukprot:758543-Hanusia_phi.AAC.3